ncbi:uncharacterized protein LOC121725422 isoform X5 [Aricia agestis]|uniref:uncharacterized protein LOC121725422 isoform X5 n=1 Tax=Aricia agestis TaxID=91739 RepID=UPI001C204DC8|nr:uncharacterized protein LOC121725422 isoform X5 [Aricia agestis]
MTDKLLIKKRSSMKAKLTHFNNHLQLLLSSECLSKLQRRDLESRFDKFIKIYDEFDNLQTEIEMHSDNLEEAYEARAQFEEQYHSLIAQAQTLLADNPDEDIKRDSGGFVTGSEDGPALVRVVSSNSEKHTARMLLDNGSTSNFITESLCDKLNLPRSSASSMVTDASETAYGACVYIRSVDSNGFITKTKWTAASSALSEGALVLVKDKSLPPLLWLLGRVQKVYPGGDGVVRVADILTRKGTLRRGFNNICPLPIEDNSSTRAACPRMDIVA